MCEGTAAWDYSSWSNHFMNQYLQQHARMTHWLQNIHSSMQNSLDQNHARTSHWVQNLHQNFNYSLDHQNHASYPYDHQNWQRPVLQQRSYISRKRRTCRRRGNSRRNSRYHYKRRSETHVFSTKEYERNETDLKEEDDDEDELVLNEEPIIAFRALKAEPEKAESVESFELTEYLVNEKFEFVQLDEAGVLQTFHGKPTTPYTKGDMEYDNDSRIVLFGDNADRIAGLETCLEIAFDNLNDLHQPVVFPVV